MFTSNFIEYIQYTIKYNKQKGVYQNLYKLYTSDQLELQAFFQDFEFQFLTNKIHLYDTLYKCELLCSITDTIKLAFIQSMETFGFTYINCNSKDTSKTIEELTDMQYTIVIGKPTDCFKTAIYIYI